jgi:hypothetical protein
MWENEENWAPLNNVRILETRMLRTAECVVNGWHIRIMS